MSTDTESRRGSIRALPDSREGTETIVSEALADAAVTDEAATLCAQYFVDGLPNGRTALEPIAERIDRTETTIAELVDAITAVQAAVVEAHSVGSAGGEANAGADRSLERSGDVSAAALGRFGATVTTDVSTLVALVADEAVSLGGSKAETADNAGSESPGLDDLESRGGDIADSTTEIEMLAEQQSDNMSHLSAEVGDISGAVEEIAATSKSVSETSDEAQRLATDGCEEARNLSERIERIHEGTEGVLEAMSELEDRTDEIDRVIEVIDDIADETNILALNASIEAARAEAGSEGFAVVADEVKSLAEQSKEQAGEIESLVRSIQEQTESAVEELQAVKERTDAGLEDSEAATQTFDAIAELTAEVAGGLDEIEDATDEQASSSEELAMMIDEAASKSERISAEISTITDETDEQLERLHEMSE